jgi:opacity protein-like surface antigen
MKRQTIVLALAATLLALPLAAAEKGQARFTFTDPAGDVTGGEGEHPADVVGVDLSSDGEFIVVAATLAEVPKPVSIFQALVLGVAFDIDNSPKTGGQGFGGMHGDVPGIDFESEILSDVNDGAPSTSSAASVIGVDAKGNQSNVLDSSNAPSTPAKGKVFTGKIAYASLGVKSGQTIRVIARELDDRGERQGMFPDAMLTLK